MASSRSGGVQRVSGKNKFQLYNVGSIIWRSQLRTELRVDALPTRWSRRGRRLLDPPKNYPYFRTYYALYFTDPNDFKSSTHSSRPDCVLCRILARRL